MSILRLEVRLEACPPSDSLGRLGPGAQNFRHTPRLRDAAAGQVRLTRVKDFTDRADAVIAQMDRESLKKFAPGRAIERVNFQPGVDEWPDQPGPDRALMIRAVAGAQVAGINRFVIGTVGRKRAQTDWRDQFFFHDL